MGYDDLNILNLVTGINAIFSIYLSCIVGSAAIPRSLIAVNSLFKNSRYRACRPQMAANVHADIDIEIVEEACEVLRAAG